MQQKVSNFRVGKVAVWSCFVSFRWWLLLSLPVAIFVVIVCALLPWDDIERSLDFCAHRVWAVITENRGVADISRGVDADRFDALLVGSSVRRAQQGRDLYMKNGGRG